MVSSRSSRQSSRALFWTESLPARLRSMTEQFVEEALTSLRVWLTVEETI